jgi:RNA polymerase sigma factor (TIGR02999 family)
MRPAPQNACMDTAGADEVAALLERARAGDAAAAGALFQRLHGELRALARSVFRSQRAGHTLQATALVNEAFLKMAGARAAPAPWQDRAHFFAVAATAMRQVLVNHARDRSAQKRGGGRAARRVTLSDVPLGMADAPADVLDVEEANPEIAEVLGRSLRTVELQWRMAKTWLAARLGGTSDG